MINIICNHRGACEEIKFLLFIGVDIIILISGLLLLQTVALSLVLSPHLSLELHWTGGTSLIQAIVVCQPPPHPPRLVESNYGFYRNKRMQTLISFKTRWVSCNSPSVHPISDRRALQDRSWFQFRDSMGDNTMWLLVFSSLWMDGRVPSSFSSSGRQHLRIFRHLNFKLQTPLRSCRAMSDKLEAGSSANIKSKKSYSESKNHVAVHYVDSWTCVLCTTPCMTICMQLHFALQPAVVDREQQR